MAKKQITRRIRRRGPESGEEQKRLRAIREGVRQEFPPRDPPRLQVATEGVAAQIRAAREARGLTWYAVAKRAGIPNPSTVRDIEYGRVSAGDRHAIGRASTACGIRSATARWPRGCW